MLIADGGSPSCEKSGYALTDYNELLLTRAIHKEFNIRDTWRTCLVKERINATALESYEKLVPQYTQILFDEIEAVNPNLIIPLGEASFRLLTHLERIRKFRGSVLLSKYSTQSRPRKVLPILGPNPYINQDVKLEWIAQIDFQKAPRFALDDSLPSEQTTNCWIAKTSSSLRAFLERSYAGATFLVFDIETYLGIPTCISFCFDGQESVCVPFTDKSIDMDNRVLMVDMIAKLLKSPIPKVNQNIKYDIKRMECFGFVIENISGDTMLAASCLTPEFDKNLGFLTSIYTDIPYFKDEGREWDPAKHHRDQYYLYNAKDSLATNQIHRKQVEELAEVGSLSVYESLVKLIPIYKQMEYNGILYDDEERQRLLAKYESLYEIESLKLRRLTGDYSLNPASSKQAARWIFDELGYPKPRQVKGTDEESLEFLMVFEHAKRSSPFVSKSILQGFINCRKVHKVIEYLRTIPYPDSRWRCEYNLSGTETGRSSAGKSTDQLLIKEVSKKGNIYFEAVRLGRSFQTIAKHGFTIDETEYGKDLRKIFVPTPGYVFVEMDLSQAEARVDAVLSGNFDILSVFDGPIGIHRLTGSWMFDCEPLSIEKNTERYLQSKIGRHAAERNMKAARLQMMIQKDLKYCQNVLDKVHGRQPEIREVFHKDVRRCIDETRTLVSPNGRRRQFLGRIDDHLYNEAISQLPQAIVSDQTKFSLIPTYGECKNYARLVNEAHDGTLNEVRKGQEMEFAQIYKKNIEIPIDFSTCSLRREFNLVIPCEASMSGESWYDLKGVEI